MLKILNRIKPLNSTRATCIGCKNSSVASSTVDNEDVKRHTMQLEHWWNPNGSMKALHSYNRIRVPFIRDGILSQEPEKRNIRPLKDKTILDVGCGGGILSEPLAKLGANVTGIDASVELIELAKQHCKMNQIDFETHPTYIHTSVEDHIKNISQQYDAVVASEIIEHVADKGLFVESCVAALKPGGNLFFTTPNRTQLSWLGGIIMAEYVLNILPKGTHDWNKFITPTELQFMLERNKCNTVAIHGMFYSVINDRWYFCETTQFCYALHARKVPHHSAERTSS